MIRVGTVGNVQHDDRVLVFVYSVSNPVGGPASYPLSLELSVERFTRTAPFSRNVPSISSHAAVAILNAAR